MADRGFYIREELMLKFCTFSVPPDARVKAQMTVAECRKPKWQRQNVKQLKKLQI